MTTHREEGDADVLLARALAHAVQEVGRSLASEPRRVQGLVSDVLGAESRVRRAEIDAVVVAAEEGVPEDLLAGRLDLPTAKAVLHRRGLDDAVASFAIEVWRFALGMLGADAEPPTLTNSMERDTSIPDDSTGERDDRHAVDHSDSDDHDHTAVFAPPVPTQAAPLAPTPGSENRRQRTLVALAAVPIALIVVAFGVSAFLQDDTSASNPTVATTESTADRTAGTTPVSSTPATTTVAAAEEVTTTIVPPPPEIVFEAESTLVGELTRKWAIDDGMLKAELTFVNDSTADRTGRVYESVPKSIVASAADIVSEPDAVVVKADPILAWDLTVAAGETIVVTYETAVPTDTTQNTLSSWQDDQLADATAFVAERATPPTLSVTTPSETIVPVTQADITGVTDGRKVTVNGVAATVNADGTWVVRVTGLVQGTNKLTTIATSTYGVTKEWLSNINVIFPTPTTQPSSGGGGGGGGTDTTTTQPRSTGGGGGGTDTTTTQPPPPPPRPTASLRGATSITACTSYTVEAGGVTNATSGSWSSSWGQSQSGGLSFNYSRPDSEAPYQVSVFYTASGPGGDFTASIAITVNPKFGHRLLSMAERMIGRRT